MGATRASRASRRARASAWRLHHVELGLYCHTCSASALARSDRTGERCSETERKQKEAPGEANPSGNTQKESQLHPLTNW